MRRKAIASVFAVLLTLALAAPAQAQDPGRPWVLTGASSVPTRYWQGLTSDAADSNLFFIGVFRGLWRTTPGLHQNAGVSDVIPPAVAQAEGYNHIGDPTWNPGDGGRVILPMECFDPGTGENTCGKGAFGVANPANLAFRYYVNLDPAEIPKAMWAETSPDGSLIWTSSGNDLLAYRSSDVSLANRGPNGPVIHPVRRLSGAVPPTGITGAVFREGRLLLAGESDGLYQVWSVNTRTGGRRLEIQRRMCGESEGLDAVPTLNGNLHWLIAPFDPGCELTFGPTSALLHFKRAPVHQIFQVVVTNTQVGTLPGQVRATVHATVGGQPLRDVRVSFAGGAARTGDNGFATVVTTLELPGRFKAFVRRDENYGLSNLVPVGMSQATKRLAAPRSGAG
ncbi:MAG TPA: hypothetical protein VN458_07845 [Solirubrobacterales bacterium]|nr:hypothetical protein [Solirubrobacterales bacterium]